MAAAALIRSLRRRDLASPSLFAAYGSVDLDAFLLSIFFHSSMLLICRSYKLYASSRARTLHGSLVLVQVDDRFDVMS